MWKLSRRPKNWARFNFYIPYARPSTHCFSLFYSYVRTHVNNATLFAWRYRHDNCVMNEWVVVPTVSQSVSLCTDAPSPQRQKSGRDFFSEGRGASVLRLPVRVSNVHTVWLKEKSLNWHWKGDTDGCNTVPTFFRNGMNFYRGDSHK